MDTDSLTDFISKLDIKANEVRNALLKGRREEEASMEM